MSESVRHSGMTMSPKEVDLVREHLRKHVRNMKCEACGETSWTLTGPFTTWPTRVTSPGAPSGGRFLPFVALVCNSCASIRQFALGPILRGAPSKIFGDSYDD